MNALARIAYPTRMPLLTLQDIQLSYGPTPLLDGIQLSLEAGERVALVGRNGMGKSTLLKIISGEIQPDDGRIMRQQDLVVARLEQAVPKGQTGSVYQVVAAGLGELGSLIAAYHETAQRVAEDPSTQNLELLERQQHALEASNGWSVEQRVATVLSRLGLDGEADFAALSGGWQRRVLLARALVVEPDVLLLDEPTNHLDVEAIEWLESSLPAFPGALLFITHDRAFLRKMATRIIELDRGHLHDWPGDYDLYLRRKAEALEVEAREQALFDRKLAEEEAWIRQGIKARRTRNEGRVRALKALRAERAQRRDLMGKARLQLQAAIPSGRLVIEAENLGFSYAGQPLIEDFSTLIMRGDKVGVVGPNGVGKTTLLRLLLGQLQPQQGQVRLGSKLEVAYFDQHRQALDETASVADNVGEGRDRVSLGGQTRHVLSYLQDFLFAPARARQPVSALSGGERNRLLLAKLFLRPANVLVLDEPTNDLDVETLEVLESRVVEFPGTVLVVSHDRDFLDNIATSIIAWERPGRFVESVGGYSDWLRQRSTVTKIGANKPASGAEPKAAKPTATKSPKKMKLGYREQQELTSLPAQIEALEARLEQLQARLGEPDFYRQQSEQITQTQTELAQVEADLEAAYARWATLEAMN